MAQLLSEAGLSVTVGFAMPAELPPESRTSHFGAWWLLWACFILLVVYPLSTGPVVLCIDRAGVNDDLIEIIYFPLIALCEACDPVAEFFQWYVGDVWGAP